MTTEIYYSNKKVEEKKLNYIHTLYLNFNIARLLIYDDFILYFRINLISSESQIFIRKIGTPPMIQD